MKVVAEARECSREWHVRTPSPPHESADRAVNTPKYAHTTCTAVCLHVVYTALGGTAHVFTAVKLFNDTNISTAVGSS